MTIPQIKQRFGIVGNCREINNAIEIAMQVAPTEVSVLVYGENGTGKDVFPRIIHQFSKRRHQPYLAVNTGAIPEGTLDSELFGHERGSFTSAYETRKGYFEEVDGGTIFLDEIGEMPLATQARLLRLLENGEYLRVGASKVRKADVRVIAATNKNLLEMIRQGRFREDLYFRLNTVALVVPPLRERGSDIELLFQYFALEFGEKYKRDPIVLDQEAVPLLYKYRWPGNVRELRNLAEKLTVLVKGDLVTPLILQKNLLVQDSYLPSILPARPDAGPRSEPMAEDDRTMMMKLIYDLGKEVAELKKMMYLNLKSRELDLEPDPVTFIPNQPSARYSFREYEEAPAPPPVQPMRPSLPLLEESLSLEKKEKEMIVKALNKHDNNRKKAASELGISERTLYRKIKNYDIDA
ncbi:MAG: sigma-54 dependent transcriptional regulator [Bacteroidia bacterium]|nr:sigma-54 dependent transcriptional regulator [Bacteroidia bacterium]